MNNKCFCTKKKSGTVKSPFLLDIVLMGILLALVTLCLSMSQGCAMTPYEQQAINSGKVMINHEASWSNRLLSNILPGRNGVSNPWRSVTIGVINGTAHDVVATVSCKYKESGTIFGEYSKMVEAHNTKTFLLRGMAQFFKSGLRCELTYEYLVEL